MKTEQQVYIKKFSIPDIHERKIMNHLNKWKKNNVIEEPQRHPCQIQTIILQNSNTNSHHISQINKHLNFQK
jgi:hypothetical protein